MPELLTFTQHSMSLSTAERQTQADAEYLKLCREHGIEAEPAEYGGFHGSGNDERLDSIVRNRATDLDRPADGTAFQFFDDADELADDEPHLHPDALVVLENFLRIIVCDNNCVQSSGRRVFVLEWMLGRGKFAGKSLARMASEIGCSRAILSWHALKIADATGLRSRLQKSEGARDAYRRSRNAQVRAGLNIGPRPKRPELEAA